MIKQSSKVPKKELMKAKKIRKIYLESINSNK